MCSAYAAAVIMIDHRIRVRRAVRRGEIVFSSGAPLQYLVLTLIGSFLVLPVYFYSTRKRATALLTGVFAWLGTCVATFATLVGLGFVLRLFL
jgi:hypothetical protein